MPWSTLSTDCVCDSTAASYSGTLQTVACVRPLGTSTLVVSSIATSSSTGVQLGGELAADSWTMIIQNSAPIRIARRWRFVSVRIAARGVQHVAYSSNAA